MSLIMGFTARNSNSSISKHVDRTVYMINSPTQSY